MIGTSANQYCPSIQSENDTIKNSGLSNNFQITGHNVVSSGTPRIELHISGDTINVTRNLVEITQTKFSRLSEQYNEITPSITVATGLTSSISTALLTIKGINNQSSNGVKLRFSTLGCSSDVIMEHKAVPANTAVIYQKTTRSSLAPIIPQEPESTEPEAPATPNVPTVDTTCGNVDLLKCKIYNEYIAQLSRGEVRSMLLPTVVSREATLELSTYSPVEGELKVDVYSTSGVYQGTVYFYAYRGQNTFVIQKNLLPQRSEHFFVIIRHSDGFTETLKGLQL